MAPYGTEGEGQADPLPFLLAGKGEEMDGLLGNIGRLHTTELGAARIKRNLGLETDDVVQWCREKILESGTAIERSGKNWYAAAGDCRITVNAHSYTIITAHRAYSIGKGNGIPSGD